MVELVMPKVTKKKKDKSYKIEKYLKEHIDTACDWPVIFTNYYNETVCRTLRNAKHNIAISQLTDAQDTDEDQVDDQLP